jgi:hypothetical protein
MKQVLAPHTLPVTERCLADSHTRLRTLRPTSGIRAGKCIFSQLPNRGLRGQGQQLTASINDCYAVSKTEGFCYVCFSLNVPSGNRILLPW